VRRIAFIVPAALLALAAFAISTAGRTAERRGPSNPSRGGEVVSLSDGSGGKPVAAKP
jgi:hypothetical protein